ncbi:MAG: peptide deformylase [Syntrophobacterales bacterium]|nr:peptide deformylase [Syntrophobacterales bacterium]
MGLLKIRTYPDPVLRERAEPIHRIDGFIKKLAKDMAETMYAAPGIGLAANQVGVPKRLIVLDLREREGQGGLVVLLNPEIIKASGSLRHEEGCLSIPGFYAKVNRYSDVVVKGQNLEGEDIEINATGLLAVVLQHEIDHLEGRLFIDRLGPVGKELFRRKWRKLRETEDAVQ